MTVGQLCGELYPAEKLAAFVRYLSRRDIVVIAAINGSYDGVRRIMTLPRDPTWLNVKHELSHLLDHRKYGNDYYTRFTAMEREQMVLRRLQNNRVWQRLNDLEREWSINYPATRAGNWK